MHSVWDQVYKKIEKHVFGQVHDHAAYDSPVWKQVVDDTVWRQVKSQIWIFIEQVLEQVDAYNE